MSNAVTQACRALQLPSTQKAVLMCLADYCHDDGRDWHSIAAMIEWTCLSKRAVIDALKGLESRGLIAIQRSLGTRNMTVLQLARIDVEAENRCTRRTGAPGAPVQEAHGTSAPGAPPPVQEAHQPVHQAHPKHQEASAKHQEAQEKKTRVRAPEPPCPEDVDPQVWADWLQLRRAKKAPASATVLTEAKREAATAGLTLEAFLRVWCVRGSQGLLAAWLTPSERGSSLIVDAKDVLPGRQVVAMERSKAALGPAFSAQSEELLRRHYAATGQMKAAGGQQQRLSVQSGFDAKDYTAGVDDDGRIL